MGQTLRMMVPPETKAQAAEYGPMTIHSLRPAAPGPIFSSFEVQVDPDTGFEEQICLLGDYRLRSVFQPIFSFAHARPIGYEALVRAIDRDGRPVSPIELFSRPMGADETMLLDRSCRALHAANFSVWAPEKTWLFLNVTPDVAAMGGKTTPFIADMLDRVGMSPNDIVIEVLEHSIEDESAFREAVKYYRDIGCVLAIDDFGAGASNFDRIWDVRPDIVKFDRSIAVRSMEHDFVRRSLPGLVSLLHETGCLILMEGIETREEAQVAMQSDVDMLQGYFFSRPAVRGSSAGCAPFFPADLMGLTRTEALMSTPYDLPEMAEIKRRFVQTVTALESGQDFSSSVFDLLAHRGVSRCFMLDHNGRQWKKNQVSRHAANQTDPRFDPLGSAKEATWIRRPYFQRAMAQPGEAQVSRPYLSLTGSHMVVTLSQTMACSENQCVFCCDLDWDWLKDA